MSPAAENDMIAAARKLAASAKTAAAFGELPDFASYVLARQRAAELLQSIQVLTAELEKLAAEAGHGPPTATMSRDVVKARLYELATELEAIWHDHRTTAEENDDIAEEFYRSADLEYDKADARLKDIRSLQRKVASNSPTADMPVIVASEPQEAMHYPEND